MTESTGKKKRKFSRRKFLVRSAVGVGVLMGAGYLSRNSMRRYIYEMADSGAVMTFNGDTKTPSIWFEVLADNQIILHSPKVEMGQGTFTSLAQMAADELEVDINSIQVVHAETATGNIDGLSTGGSTSVASLWVPLRELAATMREMIKGEAARQLSTDISSLKARDGVITGGEKSLTYGEVVAAAQEWEVPDTPALKDRKDYKYVGKPIPRVDLKDKVLGAPIFGMDASMPDMLYGAVARSSLIGAKYVDADTSAAEKMPGVVKVVKEADFVGVVATSRMTAENAKNAIKVSWETERDWQLADIEDMIQVGKGDPMVIQTHGNAKKILRDDAEIITSEYKSPIGAHAQIEPNGTLAYVEEGKATIVLSTQVVDLTRKEVAERLGLDKRTSQCETHFPWRRFWSSAPYTQCDPGGSSVESCWETCQMLFQPQRRIPARYVSTSNPPRVESQTHRGWND